MSFIIILLCFCFMLRKNLNQLVYFECHYKARQLHLLSNYWYRGAYYSRKNISNLLNRSSRNAPKYHLRMADTNPEKVDTTELTESKESNGKSEERSDTEEMIKCIKLLKFGGYNQLQVQQQNLPDPKADEVQIKVFACGVNFADIYMREGLFPMSLVPPYIMGLECAGVISKTGENVTSFQIGDSVVCHNPEAGLYAEGVCIPANLCYKMPNEMTFNEGAALLVNYLTAYFALFEFGNLHKGHTVFIHSVAGGVGCAAIQLAKTVPDVTIIGTASQQKHEAVQKKGVNHVFTYENYKTKLREVAPRGVDIYLDNLSGQDFTIARQFLKPLGKLIHVGGNNAIAGEKRNLLRLFCTWWGLKHVPVFDIVMKNQAVCGLNLKTLKIEDPEVIDNAVIRLMELFKEGKIRPHIDSVWSFDDVVKATQHMANRKNIGKIILVPNAVAESSSE